MWAYDGWKADRNIDIDFTGKAEEMNRLQDDWNLLTDLSTLVLHALARRLKETGTPD